MAEKTMVTGGARSGKSRFSEELACSYGQPLCYLATAQSLDMEMKERIERHRLRRGENWHTVEEPLNVHRTLASIDGHYTAILLDCITLWLSNLLLATYRDDAAMEKGMMENLDELTSTMSVMSTPLIIVTNEVGQGIVPENRLARLYRDIAGQANQKLAAVCDNVYVCISGIPLKLK